MVGADPHPVGGAECRSPRVDLAVEGQLHTIATGHHATERFGVRKLAALLAQFPLGFRHGRAGLERLEALLEGTTVEELELIMGELN